MRMKKLSKLVLGIVLALVTVFGTTTVAPNMEAHAEDPTPYNRSSLYVGQRLYPGDRIEFDDATFVEITTSGSYTASASRKVTGDIIQLEAVEGYDCWIVTENVDEVRNTLGPTNKTLRITVAEYTDTVTVPCLLVSETDVEVKGDVCITLPKKIDVRQFPIIYDRGEYAYGDVCYVYSGCTHDDIKHRYENYIAPAYEFDDIKYYDYSIKLPYCTNETLAAKMTIKKPEGMSKVKVYQYSTTSNKFEYLGLYENDEITIDCVYSVTFAIGHSGIINYYLEGGSDYIAFLEIKDYSFKQESLDQTYTLDKDTTLTFTADVDFAKFESVAVDGQIISADKYTAKSGSTIVELKKDYINTLSEGQHTITVNWVDGSASTKIMVAKQSTTTEATTEATTESATTATTENTVPTDKTPETGDNVGIDMLIALIVLSGMGILAFMSLDKKHNR